MLTGKMVRVRIAKTNIVPLYLPSNAGQWLHVAEQLIFVYRDAPGRTREEIDEELSNYIGEGPTQLTHLGLAKLLEDRCEFEVAADVSPDQIREAVFSRATVARTEAAKAGKPWDRQAVLQEVAEEFGISAEQVDTSLFADLKSEQRVLQFEDITPEQLVQRYNVALVQALLLKCTAMEVRIWNETPARFRQLFRAVKFHRLMCSIHSTDGNSYTIKLDGPLSLFSSTQKYGIQLALFLPTLLHCQTFDLKANVRWGTQKTTKLLKLSGADGLKSHLVDFGVHTPREILHLEENFRNGISDWLLNAEPMPMVLEGKTWVPDFTLTHSASGKTVHVEVLGFWRKVDVEQQYRWLKRKLPGQFVLVLSEVYRADDSKDTELGDGVYYFKRTPIASEVAKVAAAVAGV